MALPPLVDSGIRSEDMMPTEASVDVSVIQPVDFSGGAEVLDDGQGGAIVQSLEERIAMEEASISQPAHDDNLAEFLNEGYLGEISSDLRGFLRRGYGVSFRVGRDLYKGFGSTWC